MPDSGDHQFRMERIGNGSKIAVLKNDQNSVHYIGELARSSIWIELHLDRASEAKLGTRAMLNSISVNTYWQYTRYIWTC